MSRPKKQPSEKPNEKTVEITPVENVQESQESTAQPVIYVYGQDGKIDWRAMLKPEHLVPNKEKFPEDTDFSALDVSQLEDSQLIILLAGINYLADLRGYSSVDYEIDNSGLSYAGVKCTIQWIASDDSNGIAHKFSALADAHHGNTKSFATDYLLATAENRAFARAVRKYLKINIVSNDELGSKKTGPTSFSDSNNSPSTAPIKALENTMEKVGISFEQIKKKLILEGNSTAESWETIQDIPNKTAYEIIARIKKKSSE